MKQLTAVNQGSVNRNIKALFHSGINRFPVEAADINQKMSVIIVGQPNSKCTKKKPGGNPIK